MNFIKQFNKNRAIRSYVKKLPRLLAKDYGRFAHYSPLQIKRTIERASLNTAYSCYAVAMFSLRKDFIQFHVDAGETCNYEAMRAEIAHSYLSSDTAFMVDDIANSYSSHSSGSVHTDSHQSGDGHNEH